MIEFNLCTNSEDLDRNMKLKGFSKSFDEKVRGAIRG